MRYWKARCKHQVHGFENAIPHNWDDESLTEKSSEHTGDEQPQLKSYKQLTNSANHGNGLARYVLFN